MATGELEVGPVLDLDDAVGSKMTAMLGRGLPRDFVDVAASLRRYSRSELIGLAFLRDPGLRVVDVAIAMRRLDSLVPDDFEPYGLDRSKVDELRRQFSAWPRDPDLDEEGREVHRRAAQEELSSTPVTRAAKDHLRPRTPDQER